mgnify:CR=1 FL=1
MDDASGMAFYGMADLRLLFSSLPPLTFGCKKASEPLHIQWNPVTDEIEVVNYSAGVRNGLTAKAQIINMDGSYFIGKTDGFVDSKEDTTNKCMKLDFPASVSSAHFVKLR